MYFETEEEQQEIYQERYKRELNLLKKIPIEFFPLMSKSGYAEHELYAQSLLCPSVDGRYCLHDDIVSLLLVGKERKELWRAQTVRIRDFTFDECLQIVTKFVIPDRLKPRTFSINLLGKVWDWLRRTRYRWSKKFYLLGDSFMDLLDVYPWRTGVPNVAELVAGNLNTVPATLLPLRLPYSIESMFDVTYGQDYQIVVRQANHTLYDGPIHYFFARTISKNLVIMPTAVRDIGNVFWSHNFTVIRSCGEIGLIEVYAKRSRLVGKYSVWNLMSTINTQLDFESFLDTEFQKDLLPVFVSEAMSWNKEFSGVQVQIYFGSMFLYFRGEEIGRIDENWGERESVYYTQIQEKSKLPQLDWALRRKERFRQKMIGWCPYKLPEQTYDLYIAARRIFPPELALMLENALRAERERDVGNFVYTTQNSHEIIRPYSQVNTLLKDRDEQRMFDHYLADLPDGFVGLYQTDVGWFKCDGHLDIMLESVLVVKSWTMPQRIRLERGMPSNDHLTENLCGYTQFTLVSTHWATIGLIRSDPNVFVYHFTPPLGGFFWITVTINGIHRRLWFRTKSCLEGACLGVPTDAAYVVDNGLVVDNDLKTWEELSVIRCWQVIEGKEQEMEDLDECTTFPEDLESFVERGGKHLWTIPRKTFVQQ